MKPIPGFPGYKITIDGRVWSEPKKTNHKRGKWLVVCVGGTGYPKVVLCKQGKIYNKNIHTLLLETYIGPCPKGMEACHLNGDRQDNRLENLRWDTRKANHNDAKKHSTHQGLKNHGEVSNFSKLTEQKVKLIYNLYHSGADTQQGLADAFGVTQGCIQAIVTKKNWGYLWND